MNKQNGTSKRRKRARFRAKLIRTGVICTTISLLIGIRVGIFCGKILWSNSNTESVSSVATHQPLVTTAPTVTPDPIAPSNVNADGTIYGTNDRFFTES